MKSEVNLGACLHWWYNPALQVDLVLSWILEKVGLAAKCDTQQAPKLKMCGSLSPVNGSNNNNKGKGKGREKSYNF